MRYSETMFDTIASLLVSPEQPAQSSTLRTLDDFVIALSVDSGLPMNEVQARLEERMKLARGENVTPFPMKIQ